MLFYSKFDSASTTIDRWDRAFNNLSISPDCKQKNRNVLMILVSIIQRFRQTTINEACNSHTSKYYTIIFHGKAYGVSSNINCGYQMNRLNTMSTHLQYKHIFFLHKKCTSSSVFSKRKMQPTLA